MSISTFAVAASAVASVKLNTDKVSSSAIHILPPQAQRFISSQAGKKQEQQIIAQDFAAWILWFVLKTLKPRQV